jgi:hypothetical protein
MTLSSTTDYRTLYAVESIRKFGDNDVFCGLRTVGSDGMVAAPFALSVDATTEAAIKYQVGMHLLSPNYVPDGVSLVGVIVGGGHPALLSRVEDGGLLYSVREIDTTILFVEVSGPDSRRSSESPIYDGVLMYKPASIATVPPRPWWRFWQRG